MKQIRISDATMTQTAEGFHLSFKEKIELAKLLDKLGVDLIELEGIENARIDSLQIKSIAAAVSDSIVAVPVHLDAESVERTWAALRLAKKARLQVPAAVSPASTMAGMPFIQWPKKENPSPNTPSFMKSVTRAPTVDTDT